MVDAPAPADILDRLRPWSVDDWFDDGAPSEKLIRDAMAEITRLRSLLPPHAPIDRTCDGHSVSVPEDLLWRVSTWLRVLGGIVMSGEVRDGVEAVRLEVFRLLTEPGQ